MANNPSQIQVLAPKDGQPLWTVIYKERIDGAWRKAVARAATQEEAYQEAYDKLHPPEEE